MQLAVLAHIRFDAERIVALCQVDGHDENKRIVGRQPDFKFLVHLKLVPQITLAKPFARRVLALNANTIGNVRKYDSFKFIADKKKEGKTANKRDVAAYMRKQAKEAKEPINNAFAEAFKNLGL